MNLRDYLDQSDFLSENKILLLEEFETDEENEKIRKINTYYNQKKKELEEKKKAAIQHVDSNKEKYKESLKDFGESLRDSIIGEIEEKIDKKKAKIRHFFAARNAMLTTQQNRTIQIVKKRGLLVTGITLASLLIYNSIKLYKRDEKFFKEKCKIFTGKEKNRCIIQSRIILLRKRSEFLNTVLTRCKDSKDPVACKNRIDLEILKIEGKIQDFLNEVGGKIV